MGRELADSLVRVTIETGDARPWRLVVERAETERTVALATLVPHLEELRPKGELVRVLSQLFAVSGARASWFGVLLKWFRRGVAIAAVQEAVESSLDTREPMLASGSSLFSEIVITLARRGRTEEACQALLGHSGQALAVAGAGEVLACCWLAIVPSEAPPEALGQLVELLCPSPKGDRAVALLLRHQIRLMSNRGRDVVLARWIRAQVTSALPAQNAVTKVVDELALGEAWARVAATALEDELIAPAVGVLASRGDDPLWMLAESAHGRGEFGSVPNPYERFVSLSYFLPAGALALDGLAKGLVPDAVAETSFPDVQICLVATTLARAGVPSSLWWWVATAASAPAQFTDEVIDASIVAFCEGGLLEPDERQAALLCAEALGRAREWEALDFARWVVRFTLAPDGDGSGLNTSIAQYLVRSVARRPDGGELLADITTHILGLPEDHAVVAPFLSRYLRGAFVDEPPPEYIERVCWDGVEPTLREIWEEALG
ncbi:MAG: hypothetical protein HN348_06270 [Proteobacteria bacterium]|nr:hypothetical protein [Pseudomonadota bacterium]